MWNKFIEFFGFSNKQEEVVSSNEQFIATKKPATRPEFNPHKVPSIERVQAKSKAVQDAAKASYEKDNTINEKFLEILSEYCNYSIENCDGKENHVFIYFSSLSLQFKQHKLSPTDKTIIEAANQLYSSYGYRVEHTSSIIGFKICWD